MGLLIGVSLKTLLLQQRHALAAQFLVQAAVVGQHEIDGTSRLAGQTAQQCAFVERCDVWQVQASAVTRLPAMRDEDAQHRPGGTGHTMPVP